METYDHSEQPLGYTTPDDMAEHAGFKVPIGGECGAPSPAVPVRAGLTGRFACTLAVLHDGPHRDGAAVWIDGETWMPGTEFAPTPRGLEALIPTGPRERCSYLVPNGGGVQCDRYAGHDDPGDGFAGHAWGSGPFSRPGRVMRDPSEPENPAEALAEVCRRFCAHRRSAPELEARLRFPEVVHDPVCRLLRETLEDYLTVRRELAEAREQLEAAEQHRRRSRRPLTDGKAGGQRHAPDTTRAARDLVAPKAGTQRAKILAAFVYRLRDGSVSRDVDRTDVDLVSFTRLPANSVRPRRVELVDAGWLEPAGTRKHNGREHTTWRLTDTARERLNS